MRRSSTAFSKALLATALILPGVVLAAARPYVIFTHDGHRVLAESKPRVEGLEAYVRLVPGRQLAVMKEEQIDWKRTEAANAGREPVAIPSGSTFVERPAARRKPVTHTIVGKPTPPGNQDVPAGQTPDDTLRAQLASASEQRQQHQSRRQALLEELQTLETAGAAAAGGEDQRASRVNELRKSITDLNEAILKLNAEIEALEKEAAVQGVKLN